MFQMFFSSNVLDRVRGRTRDEIEEVLTEVGQIGLLLNDFPSESNYYLIWLRFMLLSFLCVLAVRFMFIDYEDDIRDSALSEF